MQGNKTTWIALGILAIAIALLVWYLWPKALTATIASQVALAVAARRRSRRRVRVAVSVEDYRVRDEAADADVSRKAQEAAEKGRAAASHGWTRTRTRKRPTLRSSALALLLPGLLGDPLAVPPSNGDCYPIAEAPNVPPLGYGLWTEGGYLYLCPCLSGPEYDDVTSIPQGCVAQRPVLGYTLQAHADTVADIERASTELADLRKQVDEARLARDTESTQADSYDAEAEDLAGYVGVCGVELAKCVERGDDWLTVKTLVTAVVFLGVGIGGTYAVDRLWGLP